MLLPCLLSCLLLGLCIAVYPISGASKQLRVPMPFLTTIVVPLVGNAAEHASALIFAVKNRMEISLGVAMGEQNDSTTGRACAACITAGAGLVKGCFH